MNRRLFLAPAATIAVVAGLASAPASAEDAPSKATATITVEGSASAALTPDTAILSLGVVTTRPKAGEAVEENSKALAGALAILKAQGIMPAAITTTALGLAPVADLPQAGAPKVVGYVARNDIVVRLPVSSDLGRLIAALIDRGVNAVDDLRFSSSEDAATRDRLKGDAARAARHDAEIYAMALGLTLGRVLAIRPDAAPGGGYRTAVPMAVRAAGAPVPVEPGRLDVTERVAVTFELTP